MTPALRLRTGWRAPTTFCATVVTILMAVGCGKNGIHILTKEDFPDGTGAAAADSCFGECVTVFEDATLAGSANPCFPYSSGPTFVQNNHSIKKVNATVRISLSMLGKTTSRDAPYTLTAGQRMFLGCAHTMASAPNPSQDQTFTLLKSDEISQIPSPSSRRQAARRRNVRVASLNSVAFLPADDTPIDCKTECASGTDLCLSLRLPTEYSAAGARVLATLVSAPESLTMKRLPAEFGTTDSCGRSTSILANGAIQNSGMPCVIEAVPFNTTRRDGARILVPASVSGSYETASAKLAMRFRDSHTAPQFAFQNSDDQEEFGGSVATIRASHDDGLLVETSNGCIQIKP
jgi:hypothetical protein